MTHRDERLLDACFESREPDALALISVGQGLRHYCPRRAIEPLVACAQNGLLKAFLALLDKAYFDPHESTLNQAMSWAASHGHAEIALQAWLVGASLDYASIDRAVALGNTRALELLASRGALSSQPLREGLPSEADYLFQAYCSGGCDEQASSSLPIRSSLASPAFEAAALAVAANSMSKTAASWLSLAGAPPPRAKAAWEEAFPALMHAVRERASISTSVACQAFSQPRQRL